MAAVRRRTRRASTTPDMGRLSKAVSRPGIDPRVWCVRGWVTALHVDADHGPFVDVLLQTGEEETARVGSIYAGPSYGIYAPLGVDDEVLLCAPMGNYNSGLVVVQRLHSKSDPPPAGAVSAPADLLLYAKKDANVRLQVVGAGNLVLQAEDGKVLLGSETGTKPVARKDDPINLGDCHVVMGAGSVTAVFINGVALPVGADPVPPNRGTIANGSSHVESK